MASRASTTHSVSFSTVHESGAPAPSTSHLTTYLRVLPECQVLLCTEHGACYTRDNYENHLITKHGIVRETKKRLLQLLSQENIVGLREKAIVPAHGGIPISGLPLLNGYKCQSCDFMTRGLEQVQRHCSKVHQQTSSKTAQFRYAQLQTLWAEKKYIQYFEVVPQDINIYSTNLNPTSHPIFYNHHLSMHETS